MPINGTNINVSIEKVAIFVARIRANVDIQEVDDHVARDDFTVIGCVLFSSG